MLNEPVQRLVIPNMEMRDESDFKLGSAANDSMIQTPTTPQMMGTRRKPKDFGRQPNTIGNFQSNESSMDPGQFRN